MKITKTSALDALRHAIKNYDEAKQKYGYSVPSDEPKVVDFYGVEIRAAKNINGTVFRYFYLKNGTWVEIDKIGGQEAASVSLANLATAKQEELAAERVGFVARGYN